MLRQRNPAFGTEAEIDDGSVTQIASHLDFAEVSEADDVSFPHCRACSVRTKQVDLHGSSMAWWLYEKKGRVIHPIILAMFTLLNTKTRARRGKITTVHGVIETPCFMPIATKGAVKLMTPKDMEQMGAEILLSNTYHLLLRPGMEAMREMGGLHRLMGWDKPLITDSGGYQVFSLSRLNKTSEEGVQFQSHIDGANVLLTPELSMQMQQTLGSDIVMQFDDVASGDSARERYEDAMERSLRWAKRCRTALPANPRQFLFGIVQGGVHEDLRKRSMDGLMEIGFEGYAIGGLSVGEPREDMYRMVEFCGATLPSDRPRYFMGGGMPEEIVRNVNAGVDMFDCVLPTRNARHGTLFVWKQDPSTIDWSKNPTDFYDRVRITNEAYRFKMDPIDLYADDTFGTVSYAYLRHLFSVNELTGHRIATIHNLRFYLRLMSELRRSLSIG